MAEDYAGVLKQKWHREDYKFLTNQIREQESSMRLKRRWLMDLPLSDKEQKRIEELLPPTDKIMPESFLREDDINYKDIRTCIKKAFGAQFSREESTCVQDDKKILSNICGNEMADFTTSESYRAAALMVLDELDGFQGRTLRAMHRKLKGVKGYIPTLEPSKSGWSKAQLANAVRNKCMKMLFPKELKKRRPKELKKRRTMMHKDIGTVDEPAEQLAAALGVASLTLKLIMNRADVRDFRKFSSGIEALHNDIGKAIHILNEQSKVSLLELRKVKLLWDPNSELPVSKSLSMNIRNLLIEYLYECSDMDNVPEVLIETLSIINGRAQFRSRKRRSASKAFPSSKELMKEEMEKEIEHVLNISAQAKEVVANLLPEHEFDEDFARAYMEDFEKSDALCDFDDDQKMEDNYHHFEFCLYGSYDQTESIGEVNQVEPISPVSRTTTKHRISNSQAEEADIVHQRRRSASEYLNLQDACDNSSTVAYRFVGHMLDTLAKTEGVELYKGDSLYLQNYTSPCEVTGEISDTFVSKFSEMWKNVLEH